MVLRVRHYLLLLFLLGIVSKDAIAQKVAVDAEMGEVVIKGKVGKLNAPMQIWIYMGNTSEWDSIPVQNGVFEYRKKTLLPAYGAIMVKYTPYYKGVEGHTNFFGNMNLKSLFFDAGEMHIDNEVDSIRNAVFSGSAMSLQNQYERFLDKERYFIGKQRELAAELNAASPEKLQSAEFLTEYERNTLIIESQRDALVEAEIKSHPNSLVSQVVFSEYLRRKADNLDTEQAKRYFSHFSEAVRASDAGKGMLATIVARGKPKAAPPAVRMEDGAPAVSQLHREKAFPFELKDTLGYTHRLDDFRGKTVVMDFWFTGCKGCVQVARMLREQVKPHFEGDTNVVFIAVSLDINFLQWKRSIRGGLYTSEGQLNLFTNGMGGSHPIYKYYGFSGAPQLLVIDPEGYVVSKSVILDGLMLTDLIRSCLKTAVSRRGINTG